MTKDIAKSSILVSALGAAAMAFNFLSQVVIAYLFGMGWEMDSYLASLALPFSILGLSIGGIGFLFIPVLTEYKDNNEELAILINKSFSLVAVIAIVIAFVGAVFSRPLLVLTASYLTPRKLELAAGLARIIWLMVGLSILNQFLIAINHFNKIFIFPAVTSLLPPISMLTGSALFASIAGIKSIPIALTIGSFLQCLLLFSIVAKSRDFRISLSFSHPGIRKVFSMVVPLSLSAFPFTLLPMIDVFWASRLPDGSISYLGYSSRIVIAISSVIVQGLSVVLFPAFSEDAFNKRFNEMRIKTLKAIRFIMLAAVFSAAMCFALRVPVLQIVFGRGNVGEAGILGIARVLPFYLLGMVAMSQINITERMFFAMRDFKTIATTGIILLAFYFILCGILTNYFSYMGIGMAFAAYWALTFIAHSFLLGKKVGKLLKISELVFIIKLCINALLTIFILNLSSQWLDGTLGLPLETVLSGFAGLTVFCVSGIFVFKIAELKLVFAALVNKVLFREQKIYSY
jgi:putative peptidoglycan lipid II flippase